MNDKNLELIPDKDGVLIEILDYGYIFIELGIFFIVTISALYIYIYIHYGSFNEAYSSLTNFGKFAFAYVIFRGLRIFYSAFIIKEYKIIFYKDRIKKTKTNEEKYLKDLKRANNIFWQMSSDRAVSWNPFKIIFLIIAVPAQIFFLLIIIFRYIGTVIYSKKFSSNQYSLVVVFNDRKLIEFVYGFLSKKEKIL